MTEPAPTRVVITREPWSDFFVLTLENDFTEELEPEDTRTWFREHGADMHALETALDDCWNFGKAIVTIKHFKQPVKKHAAYQPNV